MIGNLLALAAGVIVVYSRFDRHPSIAGLVMAYSLRFARMGPNMVRRIAHLEESMISVERLNHYMYEIETEPGVVDADDKTTAAGSQWRLSGGAIEFRNVVFRYRPELDPVLHGMVGVVGRTGASKSTLVQVLTRLYHIGAQDRHEGSDGSGSGVFIDGVDTATVGLRELRASIAVIPQDPVLFHGTVRSNLDPLGRFDDADLHQALGAAGLAGHSDVGLDAPVSEGGANLSAGQSQLLCLARAMLVQARIVVLDEATASVDAAADELIQRVIATKFRGCTVITIAHRLNTIMDYDRVLVMDAGRVVETGPPHALLADPDSHFARMAAAAQAH
ncbi:P-loop containing nucleoside triphosphate hydrolase protein [Ramicandelaber brevisporus]|nr:P-loop containing nucleoside triphosphate hydrolase protein [Ramicandelaber brevisporus]